MSHESSGSKVAVLLVDITSSSIISVICLSIVLQWKRCKPNTSQECHEEGYQSLDISKKKTNLPPRIASGPAFDLASATTQRDPHQNIEEHVIAILLFPPFMVQNSPQLIESSEKVE